VNRSAQERVAETLWLAKATEGTAQEPGKKREDIFFFLHCYMLLEEPNWQGLVPGEEALRKAR
jgi:hypothetical protein